MWDNFECFIDVLFNIKSREKVTLGIEEDLEGFREFLDFYRGKIED